MSFNISYLYQVVDKASGPIKRIVRAQNKAGAGAEKVAAQVRKSANIQKASINDLQSVFSNFVGIAATGFAFGFPIKQAIDFESAMADVAKVVTFKSPDGLAKMGKTIQELSKTIPVSQKGLADIVAQGGQLGVPANKLAAFATQASKMSIAFDIAPDQAAKAMAKLSNIFDRPIESMKEVGDAINYVSNNSSASAAEIVTALKAGAGAGARALSLTENQAISLSASLIAQGLSASEAGTRVQTLGRNLLNTAKTQKIFGAGFDKMIRSKPQETLNKVFDLIKKGRIPQSDLNKLLGETVNDFVLLANNSAKYAEIQGMLANSTNYANSMQEEFSARSSTTANQLQLLVNNANNVAINFGSALLPAVNNVASALSGMSDVFAYFFERAPWMSKVIGGIAAGIIALRSAIFGAKIAMIGFNLVMNANPITLAITIIAALIGVLIAFSDEIGSIINQFMDFIGIGDQLSSLVSSVGNFLGFSDDEQKAPDIKAPGASEVNGQIGVNLNLRGNTNAVESISARQLSGNVGMNLAGATP